jgi:outer membrane usher protein FimD/PapC
MRDQSENRASRLSYSHNLGSASSFFTTLQRVSGASGATLEFFVGLMIRLDGRHTASAYASRDSNGSHNFSTQLVRNTPMGEGLGYRVGWSRMGPQESDHVTSSMQWNARSASLTLDTADSSSASGSSARREAALMGSIAWADGAWGLARQVNESFALVRVGTALEGVRVYANSQEIGRTDASGQLVVPSAAAFAESRIGI